MITKAVKFTLLTLTIATSFIALPSYAASACKGKAETACESADSCYWVTSYKRTDGATVKAHCRTKAKASIANSANKKKESVKSKSTNTKTEKTSKETSKKAASSTKKKIENSDTKTSS